MDQRREDGSPGLSEAEMSVRKFTSGGDDFPQKLETILPETRNMTNSDCLALLMGDESDDPPQEIENLFYRSFLDVSF